MIGRLRGAGIASAALAIALTGCAAGPEPGAAPLAAKTHYVAMGSSFAAGSGFGPIKPDTPPRCGRSTENYAAVLAQQLDLALTDVTCGGATTAHILGSWNELPPQIDAVTANTALVTVTIGGNDIGYVGYLLGQSCQRAPIMLPGGIQMPCNETKAPAEPQYQRLEADLRALASSVKARAPKARLVFVQYFPMVPDTLCDAVSLSPKAAETARTIGKNLARITATVAQESGAIVIPVDTIDESHMPCGSDPWVTAHPAELKPGDAFPWHPTRAGHAAIARALVELLKT